MTERKKWDRTKSSQMMFDKKYSDLYSNGVGGGGGGGASASSVHSQEQLPLDPIAEKQRQYIKMLEERNRLKKKLESNKTQKEKELQQREEQFITTFNGSYIVPSAATTTSTSTTVTSTSSNSSSSVPIRKNKSSSAMLPTRLTNYNPHATTASPSAQAKDDGENNSMTPRESNSGAKTAPGKEGGNGERSRQKWSRPQGQFGTESKGGKTLLFIREDKKGSSDSEEIEEEEQEAEAYLEESFEEFEEDDEAQIVDDSMELEPQDAKGASSSIDMSLEEENKTRLFTRTRTPVKVQMQVPVVVSSSKLKTTTTAPLTVIDTSTRRSKEQEEEEEADDIHEEEEDDDFTRTSSISSRSSKAHSPQQQQEIMSRTTTELFGIIQNLSRTKQKALMDVLQTFHQSNKSEQDKKQLQKSIGDPLIWKRLSQVLQDEGDKEQMSTSLTTSCSSTLEKKSPTKRPSSPRPGATNSSTNSSTKEPTLEERLQLEQVLKEKELREQAEARRKALLRKFEEEEKELERLMEEKRQQTLLKLQAYEKKAQELDQEGHHHQQEQQEEDTCLSSPCTSPTNRHPYTKKSPGKKKKSKSNSPHKNNKSKSNSLQKNKVFVPVAGPAEPKEEVDTKTSVLLHKKDVQEDNDLIPKLCLSSTTTSVMMDTPREESTTEIRLSLLSSWGKSRAIGLTQISVYDSNGCELEVDLNSLKLYEGHLVSSSSSFPKSHEMVRTLNRLFNGIAQTNHENDMWLGRLSSFEMPLQIVFTVHSLPSKLCIWNYNSKLTSKACVQDIEVFINGRCMWTGSLCETFGDEEENLCTWINVQPSARKHTSRVIQEDALNSEVKSSRSPLTTSLSASCLSSSSLSSSTSASRTSSTTTTSTSNAPMWLMSSSSSSSSTLTSGLPLGKPPLPALDLKALDDTDHNSTTTTTGGGRLTSRTRATNVLHQPLESTTAESKSSSSREGQAPIPSRRMSNELKNSWDSLEYFRKSNKSRLPQFTGQDGTTIASTTNSSSNSIDPPSVEAKEQQQEVTPHRRSSVLTEEISRLLLDTKSQYQVSSSSFSSATTRNSMVYPLDKELTVVLESETESESDLFFHLPILPRGIHFKMEILSTWGDPYYVGLNGIELFDEKGCQILLDNPFDQVQASPSSINVLEEYENDPRLPQNLVDGQNFTCDDFHLWLTPYTIGKDHTVDLYFSEPKRLSMVRIWNYNKSREHSYRGVKHVRMWLFEENEEEDEVVKGGGQLIFEGEIRKAPGLLSQGIEECAEVILFTTDPNILSNIEVNDQSILSHREEEEEAVSLVQKALRTMEQQRPRTSDRSGSSMSSSSSLRHQMKAKELAPEETYENFMSQLSAEVKSKSPGKDGRPKTAVVVTVPKQQQSGHKWTSKISRLAESKEEDEEEEVDTKAMRQYHDDSSKMVQEEEDEHLIRGRRICIRLKSTWGDGHYIGLTGLQVLIGRHITQFTLSMDNVEAHPRDLHTLGYQGDPRTLDKLLDGITQTCDDTHMWLIPFQEDGRQEIQIDLKKEQYLYGLRVYNYNKSHDDTFRGVKQMDVSIDGVLISPKETGGFLIRKAPGNDFFDFGQVIPFNTSSSTSTTLKCPLIPPSLSTLHYKTPIIKQDYEAPLFPQGFNLKFVFWSTWGDPYYLGINGIELYDPIGKKLNVQPSIVTAKPFSVGELNPTKSSQEDVRVPANLLNGRNNTWDASDMWLSPLASSIGNNQGNIVFIVFDVPICLSMIKVWNYSKNPERGAREVDIFMDDLKIYSGSLRKAPNPPSLGRNGNRPQVIEDFSQPILFTNNQAQVDNEKRRIVYCGQEEQDVLCINEGKVVHESKAMHRAPDPGAEGVQVDLSKRPMTSTGRT